MKRICGVQWNKPFTKTYSKQYHYVLWRRQDYCKHDSNTVPRWAYQFSLRIALNIFVLVLRIWLVNQDNIPSRADDFLYTLSVCSVKYRYTEEIWYFNHSWDWSEYVFQNLSIMLPLPARFQIATSKCEEIETGRGWNFIRCLTRLYLPSRERKLGKNAGIGTQEPNWNN